MCECTLKVVNCVHKLGYSVTTVTALSNIWKALSGLLEISLISCTLFTVVEVLTQLWRWIWLLATGCDDWDKSWEFDGSISWVVMYHQEMKLHYHKRATIRKMINVIGFWKIDQIVTLSLFHFTAPANDYTCTLHKHSAIIRLGNWFTFLEWVLLTL